jgi:hypothetical protein
MTNAASPARLLVLIGSGETAAQMTRVHRSIVKRLAGPNGAASDLTAAVLDTPFGFQENADELSTELVDYFGRRLGMPTYLASLRRADAEILDRETAFSRIRDADFVFSGPGSPSYALKQWQSTGIGALFARRLQDRGALVLASAAALTIGSVALPVYEIYKAGEDPYWLPGLDVLGTIGIGAAVVPHFDNHDGSGHDTRFCFLGERRLRALEGQLGPDDQIIGIDEHTAVVLDIGEDTATVHGRGVVTLRRQGTSRVFPAGTEFALDELRNRPANPTGNDSAAKSAPGTTNEMTHAALARRTLELEGRVSKLNERADRADELVAMLVELRAQARDRGDYRTADSIRRSLGQLGLELRDNPDGSTSYRPGSGEAGG